MLARQIDNIGAVPNQLLQLVCSCSMVCQQAAFVASHGQVVHEEGACNGLICRRVEGALERFQEIFDIFVEISNFSCYCANELGLVRWQVCEVLRPLGVLNLADDQSRVVVLKLAFLG